MLSEYIIYPTSWLLWWYPTFITIFLISKTTAIRTNVYITILMVKIEIIIAYYISRIWIWFTKSISSSSLLFLSSSFTNIFLSLISKLWIIILSSTCLFSSLIFPSIIGWILSLLFSPLIILFWSKSFGFIFNSSESWEIFHFLH